MIGVFLVSLGYASAQGGTWQTDRDSAASFSYQGIAAYDSAHYVAIGESNEDYFNHVRQTSDAGRTWQSATHDSAIRYNCVAYPSRSLILVGTDEAFIKRSTDGGITWNRVHCVELEDGPIEYISMFDSVHGVFVAGGHEIKRTDDAGLSWQLVPVPASVFGSAPIGLWDIACLGSGRYVVIQNLAKRSKKTFHTEDGGIHWDSVVVATGISLFFRDSLHGWMAGFQYPHTYIYRTMDGARTWDLMYEDTLKSSDTRKIQFADSAHGMVLFSASGVIKTTDGGNTWIQEPINDNGKPTSVDLIYPTPSRALVVSSNTLYFVYTPQPSGVAAPVVLLSSMITAYPNPARERANIRYRVSQRGKVRVIVTDALGRVVLELVNGEEESGEHHIEFDAGGLGSGVYFIHLEGQKQSVVQPLVVDK